MPHSTSLNMVRFDGDVILSRLSEEHQQTNKTLGNVVREFGRRVLV
jgi:hypothetical protein